MAPTPEAQTRQAAPSEEQRRPPRGWAILSLAAGLLMGAAGFSGYLSWALNGGLVRDGNWIGVDFHVYYQAAQVLRRGQDIYAAGISPPYVYPPLLAALVTPLSMLNVTAATITWKLLQHSCLLAAGGLLLTLLPKGARPLGAGVLLLGGLTVPVRDEIQVGESNSIVLALTVGALWLVARSLRSAGMEHEKGKWAEGISGWEAAAGLLLALAAGIKVLPLLVVAYFLLRWPRSTGLWAAGGFLLLQAVSFIITPATGRYWLQEFPSLFGQAFPYLDNQSIGAAVSRAFLPGDPALPDMRVAEGETLRLALTWALNTLILVCTAAFIYVSARRPAPRDSAGGQSVLLLEVSLVLLMTNLVSGSTWLHHLVGLWVPFVGLLRAAWQRVDGRNGQAGAVRVTPLAGYAAAACALILPAELVLTQRPYDLVEATARSGQPPAMLSLLLGSAGTLVVLLLWLVVGMVLLLGRPRTGPESAA